jgi:hypothetical protein
MWWQDMKGIRYETPPNPAPPARGNHPRNRNPPRRDAGAEIGVGEMTMQTEQYCDTLESLSRTDAVRAIHEAWLQLTAAQRGHIDNLDHAPALESLAQCLATAGHVGFQVDVRLNRFQKSQIARLAEHGVIAKPYGNWIEVEAPNGDGHTIMTFAGVDMFLRELKS